MACASTYNVEGVGGRRASHRQYRWLCGACSLRGKRGLRVFTILKKEEIGPKFWRFLFAAPDIARKHRPGQFVMVLIDEDGERIPLTLADSDPQAGTITLVVQEVGKTTMQMGALSKGFELLSVVGPLGAPTHIEKVGTVVCVGGGGGIAPLLPIARGMRAAGNHVISILGGRTKELVILRPEMEAASDEVIYTTDDGSFGRHGLVTHALTDLIAERGKPELVVAIGPAIMMKVVSDLTRRHGIRTLVSLNTVMIDGTGMCGGCRVTVGNEAKFVCVDGPEFDGHEVDFDLPKAIVDFEIANLERMGVEIKTSFVVGKTATVDELFHELGYDAIFVGTGAGLPYFLGIPGENFIGVLSANEFLTRVNLMKAYRFPAADTPVRLGRRVAVIGAGNVAMDCLRCAKRLGAEEVICVYRRTRAESPARAEELERAEEEKIDFRWLSAPLEIFGNEEGFVTGMRIQRMELGEPDSSGRRRPLPIPGSEYEIPIDTVIVAVGQGPNPLVTRTTPGLELNRHGCIVVDKATQMSSIPGVFAGGDIVTGAATVILAMGAGRKAAAIHDWLGKLKRGEVSKPRLEAPAVA